MTLKYHIIGKKIMDQTYIHTREFNHAWAPLWCFNESKSHFDKSDLMFCPVSGVL
jgi:hypothetical protein